jgi:8-oxo-dGTP diphosphatase
MSMVQVVAAVIERAGAILVGQRTRGQSHALKWEFPGGKVESGESPEQALARELEEELGILGATGTEITRYRFVYSGKNPIELIFFRVSQFTGEPRNVIFEDLHWHPKSQLAELDFVEGDREFLEGIYTGAYGNSD